MRYQEQYDKVVQVIDPLTVKLFLLLYDRPQTRNELYDECSNINNKTVKSRLDAAVQQQLLTGGQTRGDPYRLNVVGRTVAEWMLEGGMLLDHS